MTIVTDILKFMLGALGRAWPYLLVSIPLSVAVNVSGVGGRIRTLIGLRPGVAVVLATLFGALSPLCSCTVIPVIYSLLVAGVPLGPVMAFWIASPSMDPEIFFLSVSTLGWNLAVWRLASTFVLSLGAGFLALALEKRGFFAEGILRESPSLRRWNFADLLSAVGASLRRKPAPAAAVSGCGCAVPAVPAARESTGGRCCGGDARPEAAVKENAVSGCGCKQVGEPVEAASGCGCREGVQPAGTDTDVAASGCGCSGTPVSANPAVRGATRAVPGRPLFSGTFETVPADRPAPDGRAGTTRLIPPGSLADRILRESLHSLLFVGKFMLIAYFLEAVIVLYLPAGAVEMMLGRQPLLAVGTATLFGLPFYTTNLASLGIMGGLLGKGMLPGAALAFLISGPTTTLPAMSAVFGIARRRVFVLYLGVAFAGAVLFGLLAQMFS